MQLFHPIPRMMRLPFIVDVCALLVAASKIVTAVTSNRFPAAFPQPTTSVGDGEFV